MHFRSARAHSFRLLRDLRFELHPELNYFIGGNGAGKTSVLEALHVLARASSHRSQVQNLASDGGADWFVEGELALGDGSSPPTNVQIRWANRRISVEMNRNATSLSQLVKAVPLLLLDPAAHRIMEEGPGIRRRYVDWGVFHMEQRFHSAWSRMSRALKQRNSGLRNKASNVELAGWNRELASASMEVTAYRKSYVLSLQSAAVRYWSLLLGETTWSLRFQAGWNELENYSTVLERNQESERKLGYTREGPHRAELQILGDNTQLRDRVSRGQQKLLVAALILAQGDLYLKQHGSAPVLLVDDFAAELSRDSQSRLLDVLRNYPGQKIIAALDYSEAMLDSNEHFMFHMEHGQITEAGRQING